MLQVNKPASHIFLQAFSQVPDLNIWYGPDSYMGANIKELFQQMTKMTDEEIAEIHPAHNRDSIRSLLPHLHFYQVVFFFFLRCVCVCVGGGGGNVSWN